MTAEEIKALLTSSGICRSPTSMVGLSDAEIAEHERRFGEFFPYQYRELLRAIGGDSAEFFVGTDLFSPFLNDGARDLLVEDAESPLPPRSWVFSMHQGYQFDFFVNDGSNDPPVHKYIEGTGWQLGVWPSVSQWIVQGVEWHLQFR